MFPEVRLVFCDLILVLPDKVASSFCLLAQQRAVALGSGLLALCMNFASSKAVAKEAGQDGGFLPQERD
jgi:hypothetical protein